ncbi:MAG: 2'-deoxycytidine 5'-triphosphate deaminase [Patescibacteria group bacterium]
MQGRTPLPEGVLSYQELREMQERGVLSGFSEKSFQPASVDLSITEEAYRLKGNILPQRGESVREMLVHAVRFPHDLSQPLEVGASYLCKIREGVRLPGSLYAYANPKSSTGRNDIQARLVADGVARFDTLPRGFSGELWLLLSTRHFLLRLTPGDRLLQIRLFTGDARVGKEELEGVDEAFRLLWTPTAEHVPLKERKLSDHDGSILMTLDLKSGEVAGFQAKYPGTTPLLEFNKTDHNWEDFFEPIQCPADGALVLEKGIFYIFYTQEWLRVPPSYAAEMVAMDARSGEFRSHYAGFIDPGWGYGTNGEEKGWPLVLEARPFDDNLIVRHEQPICKLVYERIRSVPELVYGQTGAHYTRQKGAMLSKHFSANREEEGKDLLDAYAPPCEAPSWDEETNWALSPFVTSVSAPVYSFRTHLVPSQLLGALFSRASRAKGDLREVFWKEYLQPILHPAEENEEARALASELRDIIAFHHEHSRPPYNTEHAFQFFSKWLAQYGDDSIAQMASTNLIATALSQPALKWLEDQRVGIAPIEKSTRYVDYGAKVLGKYRYYTDPSLQEWGLKEPYENAMNSLFDAYTAEIPKLISRLEQEFPEEKRSVLEKKSFDVLRGLLPLSTLSQVAFHGNAQAFKYMIDRCAAHPLGELRWFAREARKALDEEIPSLLLRLDDDVTKEYQRELISRRERVRKITEREFSAQEGEGRTENPRVLLAEYDLAGEAKVIAALLFEQGDSRLSWAATLAKVQSWPEEKKREVLAAHFAGRKARWQKVGRALENAFVRFEIIMNAGSYRDLHRHRMHTQERQRFTCHLGYEILPEVEHYGLASLVKEKAECAEEVFRAIEARNPEIAQYVPTMFHFVRFYQYQNLRQFFWEVELRTGSQGRPDYRWVEQEKYRLLQSVYPLIMQYVQIDLGEYDLARRGTEEKIQEKRRYLLEKFKG